MTTEEAVKLYPQDKELLEKALTYHEFCDLMTDAFIETSTRTGLQPSDQWRMAFFSLLQEKVKAFEAA